MADKTSIDEIYAAFCVHLKHELSVCTKVNDEKDACFMKYYPLGTHLLLFIKNFGSAFGVENEGKQEELA